MLGIEAGSLEVGADADVCVFDPEATWTVNSETLKSRGKNTPFINTELKGRVTLTLLNGQPVHRLKS